MKNLFVFSLFSFCFITTYSQSLNILNSDSIVIEAIPFRCVVLDAIKEFKVISKNALLMTAANKTDLHNPVNQSYYRHNAPKLLFKPHANFEFYAKVKPLFQNKYDGGALLIYSDEETWAKVLLQYTPGNKSLLGISVVKNKITDDSYYDLLDTKEIYLRVIKNGNVINFSHSVNGKDWFLLREFAYSKPDNLRIGFYTQSPVGAECTVEFSEITYKPISH